MPSAQRVYGGGKFRSERQRRAMWANAPSAARAWAHNQTTTKPQWRGMHGGARSAVRSVGRMSTKAAPRSMASGRHRTMSMKRTGGRGRV